MGRGASKRDADGERPLMRCRWRAGPDGASWCTACRSVRGIWGSRMIGVTNVTKPPGALTGFGCRLARGERTEVEI
jgi:hypothetical protein